MGAKRCEPIPRTITLFFLQTIIGENCIILIINDIFQTICRHFKNREIPGGSEVVEGVAEIRCDVTDICQQSLLMTHLLLLLPDIFIEGGGW